MISRCYYEKDISYCRYGARGIRVCNRWRHSFAAFLEDVGKCPKGCTIERIDGTKDYEPGNVRWANKKEQAVNRKTTHRFDFQGKTMTLSELAEATGVHYQTLRWRLMFAGWPFEKAIERNAT